MPGAYLLHNVRQGLFQMLVLHIPQVSSYWLCPAPLGQGHLHGWDLREKEKHWGGGRYWTGGWQTGEGWGEMIYLHKIARPSSAPWWVYLRGSLIEGFSLPFHFPESLDCRPRGRLKSCFPWPPTDNKASGETQTLTWRRRGSRWRKKLKLGDKVRMKAEIIAGWRGNDLWCRKGISWMMNVKRE